MWTHPVKWCPWVRHLQLTQTVTSCATHLSCQFPWPWSLQIALLWGTTNCAPVSLKWRGGPCSTQKHPPGVTWWWWTRLPPSLTPFSMANSLAQTPRRYFVSHLRQLYHWTEPVLLQGCGKDRGYSDRPRAEGGWRWDRCSWAGALASERQTARASARGTYPTASDRLRYQSLISSWLLDISMSLALGKVSWKE